MIYYKITIVIVTLIGTVTAIPDHFLCCSPEMGTFKYINSTIKGCWDEKSNKSSPYAITCSTFDLVELKYFNLNTTNSGQVYHVEPDTQIYYEFKRGETCFANDSEPNSNEIVELVVTCRNEKDESAVGYCMIVSALFLLFTMVVYAILPEIRDVQGKCIINFCGSMGIGLILLSLTKLTGAPEGGILSSLRGFMMYFFLVAAFFWTNAISIQVLLSLKRPVVNNYSWKEFSWYALYAWGCPIMLTLCMAIANYVPGDHAKPGISLRAWWFENITVQWYYMYSVMLILIVANICIFIYTSIHLWRLSFSSSHVKALKYKFLISLRMFIIMGISWIFEMISSLTEENVIWFVIDVFNALQGPLIFLLLVVFRKRVIKVLLRRGYLSCIAGPVERYLALREDDEEGVIQQTIDVTMNDRDEATRNGI